MKLKYYIIFLILLLAYSCPIWGQNEFSLRAQFNGSYDFTAIGNTLNLNTNFSFPPNPCEILTSSDANLNLDSNQTVAAAYLYWSGNGNGEGNYTINLNGNQITSDEIDTVYTEQNQTYFQFFGCVANVTNLVQTTGNGTYAVSDFDLTNVISPYCTSGYNYGGWAIVIVYQQPDLPAKQVNVYDGLESVNINSVTSVNIDLNNLNVVSPQNARLGFVAWNGSALRSGNESLKVNGITLSNPPLNPADNIFNSTNSYTGATDLWNMDLDYFDISNAINTGDTNATITLSSYFVEYVALQNVVTAIESQLPDATIEITSINGQEICGNHAIAVQLTVSNTNATDALPANTPVSLFYTDANANEVFLQTIYTQTVIPIGGSENLSTTLNLPANVPQNTTIIAKVNTLQDGSHPVNENNTENNTAETDISLQEAPDPPILDDLSKCGTLGETSFNLNDATTQIDQGLYAITFYPTAADAENESNPLGNIDNYIPDSPGETIFVRIDNGNCHAVNSFVLTVLPKPETIAPTPLKVCDDLPADGFATFQLNAKNQEITGGNTTYTVSYFATQPLAETGEPADALPNSYTTTEMNSQTIFARVEDPDNGCFSITSLVLEVDPPPAIATEVSNLEECKTNSATEADFALTEKKPEILNGLSPELYAISFYDNQADAQTGDNAIPDPTDFNSAEQTIFVRVVNNATGCFALVSFDLIILDAPEITSDEISDIVTCADPDGITVDLTQKDNAIDPNTENTQVVYYAGTADYQNNDAIENPANFQPVEIPQLIIAEVVNTVNGCASTTAVNFDIQTTPLPEVDLSAYDGTVICTDPQTGTVLDSLDLPVLDTGLSENNFAFSWTRNGEILDFSGPAYPVEEAGVYSVTVTDITNSPNCENSASVTILESSRPLFRVSQVGGTFDGDGLSVGNVFGNGSYEFSLDGGAFQFLPSGQENLIFENVKPGIHTVIGRDLNGCGETMVKAVLLGFPKFFTPNGDGKNDRWNISALSNQTEAKIYIFDRFGKLLFTAKPDGSGWNGDYNGKPMPSNDYWFKVNYTDPENNSSRQFISHFTLVR